MKECWKVFFSYILFLIFSPIRFLPYTFSPLSIFSNFANLQCTPKQNQAPFLSSKDPQRTAFKTLGGIPPHKAMKECWKVFFSYILFLIFSPIRFLPYTFSPLSIFSNFANLQCTPKQNQAPFLSSKDPQRTSFKTLGGGGRYQPTRQ